jgi:hypothetical protein
LIDRCPQVSEITEKITDAGLHERRQHILVCLGNGFQRSAIDGLVEREHSAVESFQRIVGIMGGGASPQTGGHD